MSLRKVHSLFVLPMDVGRLEQGVHGHGLDTGIYSPLLHAIGFPALGQYHTAHHWFPPQSHIIISHVSIEVATEATYFVLQPLTDADFDDVEAIVVYLDVGAGVNHQKPLAAVDFGCQTSYKWNIYLCAVYLVDAER